MRVSGIVALVSTLFKNDKKSVKMKKIKRVETRATIPLSKNGIK